MNREKAEQILSEMTLEDCIKMWNESDEKMYRRNEVIRNMESDKDWEHLSSQYGAYYLVHDISHSVKEKTFCPFDDYFFYNGDDCRLYSFTEKKELIELLGEWFIDELINRK